MTRSTRLVRLSAAAVVAAGLLAAPAASAVETSGDPIVSQPAFSTPGNPELRPFEEFPDTWEVEWELSPEWSSIFVFPSFPFWESPYDVPEATYRVVDAPDHGTFAVVPNTNLRAAGFGYRAKEGFTGTDSITLEWTKDGVTKTERITVNVNDPDATEPTWRIALGSHWELATDVAGLSVAETTPVDVTIPGQPGSPTAPETPAPAEPTAPAPAEPTTPAESAPAEPAEGEHTVPESVETGQNAIGLAAAAVAAVGVGALVRVRRAFGLV